MSLSYLTCTLLDFSGAIASVVCGVLFSALINYYGQKGKSWDLTEFDIFWEIVDNLLNSILYVILGLTFILIRVYKN